MLHNFLVVISPVCFMMRNFVTAQTQLYARPAMTTSASVADTTPKTLPIAWSYGHPKL